MAGERGQLERLGYTFATAQEHEDFDVYLVEGPGVRTYVRSDDTVTLETFVASHDEREFQQALDSDTLDAWVQLTIAENVDVKPPPATRKESRPLVNGKRVDVEALPRIAAELVKGEE